MSHENDRIERDVEIEAPVRRVWQALTDYRQFGEWFGVVMDGPFAAGQMLSGEISRGCSSEGKAYPRLEIVVQAIEPETYFSYTWHPYAVDAAVDYSAEPSTLVEFHLAGTATGTHLRVVESGFAAIPEARRAIAVEKNGHGWVGQMKNIGAYVSKAA